MESPSPRSHRESVVVSAEELLHPPEAHVYQLSQELTQTDPEVPALSEDEVITKLNMCVRKTQNACGMDLSNGLRRVCLVDRIAETLEEVETTFRKERSSPYRRDGEITVLLQVG
jgi:hypothetical protein